MKAQLRSSFNSARRLSRDLHGIYRTADGATFAKYCVNLARVSRQVLSARSLRPVDGRMAGRRCTFRVFGAEVVLEGREFAGAREMYCRRVYFAPPHFRLQANDVVLDLGANCGHFSLLAALLSRRVIAVEAQSGFLPEIERNLRLNGMTGKAKVVWGLVGPRSGVFADEQALTMASHYAGRPPILSMHEIIAQAGVELVDFLKVDIEGSEFDLLTRENDWLASVGRMAMEVHAHFGDPELLTETVRGFGFRSELRDNDMHPVRRIEGQSGYLFAWR